MKFLKKHRLFMFGSVGFHHPIAFWLGVIAVTSGVIAHLPIYFMGRDNGYKLAGMPMDKTMIAGMVAIMIGFAASLYGLYPRSGEANSKSVSSIRISALDNTHLNSKHLCLLLAMAFAVMIDIMKPTALAFVIPGMTAEYGLKSPLNPEGTLPAAWVALAGITGTAIGSFFWGWLGDKIGRRASILYAGIGFIGTSVCGAMPDFYWNLAMCFLMGVTVGGMLPICYTLLAEIIPASHRGWLMILIGADIAGAYILTSWLAVELVPIFSWRILWLIGLPTGVIFILLNQWIPESPRFLLANGRETEAYEVMAQYGASITKAEPSIPGAREVSKGQWRELLSLDYIKLTLMVGFLALGSGIVLFGFNLWIPTNLRKLGFYEADSILRNAALMGFPLTFLVAWLYGFWSSRKTIIILGSLTAAALFGFVLTGDAIVQNRLLLYGLLVVPIWGISSVIAVLSVYSSEIFPTRIRARGAGFAAGMSKAGGVAIIFMVSFGFTEPAISSVALFGAIPMILAVMLVAVFGIETCHRRLEMISVAGRTHSRSEPGTSAKQGSICRSESHQSNQ